MKISLLLLLITIIFHIDAQTYRIGALMTVGEIERIENPSYTGTYESSGQSAINGWRMWESMVNENGITVGNVTYDVEITLINVGATNEKVASVTNETCLGLRGEFDILFAPFTSGFTGVSAGVVEQYDDKLLMAAFGGSRSLYQCRDDWESVSNCFARGTRRFENTWGMKKVVESSHEDIMKILKLKGAETIFTWTSDSVFPKSIVQGAEEQASRNDIEVYERIVVAEVPTTEEIEAVVDRIEELQPDIVVAAPRHWAGCVEFIKTLKARKVTVKAISIGQCTTYPEVLEELGEDIRFFIDTHPWSLHLKGFEYSDFTYFPEVDDKSSVQLFSEAYQARFGVEPDHVAAAAFVQGQIVEHVLERGSTLDRSEFVANLRLLSETSFFGELGYNGFGVNDVGTIPGVQYDVNTTLQLVSPLGSSTLELVYPFPGWDERVQVVGYLGQPAELVIFVITLVCVFVSIILAVMIMLGKESNNSVNAASPYFLLLILLGSLLMYASVITWMMWMNTYMCIAKTWLLGVGFVLIFGTLVAKTHRIKKIFLFNSFTVKAITDTQLFGLVCLLVGIEILINLAWSVASPSEAYNEIIDENRPLYNYYTCSWNTKDTVFLTISIVYKALIVIYSLYLSTKLWRHSRSVFVESKQIIFTIYNLTIFGGIFAAIQLSLQNSEAQTMLFVLRSGCIIISVLIAVLSMTIPRLTNPNKSTDYSISKKGTGTTSGSTQGTVINLDYKKKYLNMKKLLVKTINDYELSVELSD